MNRNFGLPLFIGTLVSVTGLYFAFRRIPFDDLLNYLLSINYIWILPTVAIILIVFSLRAFRWGYILSSEYSVGFWQAFHPLMIGFMVNCILPGRVGEVARPIVLSRYQTIPVSAGLATVVVERIFDLVVLLLLFMIISTYVHIDPDINLSIGGYYVDRQALSKVFQGMVQLSGFLILSLFLVCFSKPRQIIKKVVLAAPKIIPLLEENRKISLVNRISKPIIGIIDNIASGVGLIRQPKRIIVCLLYSLAVWFFTALSYYVFSVGCPEISLSFNQMVVVMVIICFAIALPSVPGYWGLWEVGGVFAMLLFGISEKDAAGFTLANHVVQIIPVVIIGLASAWISGVNIRRIYQKH